MREDPVLGGGKMEPDFPTPTRDNDAIVDIYKAYLDDANQFRSNRATIDTTYIGVLTLFLGGQAYAGSVLFFQAPITGVREAVFASLLPLLALMAAGSAGHIICGIWADVIEGNANTLNFKYEFLEKLEQHTALRQMGAQLFTEESKDRIKDRKLKKRTRGAKVLAQAQVRLFRHVFSWIMIGAPIAKASIVCLFALLPTLPTIFQR
jgi:hypothetical protein